MRVKKQNTPNQVNITTTLETTQTSLPLEEQTTKIETKENQSRGSKQVLEKASAAEKDSAPQIVLQYVDQSGQRRTKTFGCASIRLAEYKDQNLSKTGMKTTLNISIEAVVLEVN